MPPQRSGIADYSYRLVSLLRERVDLVLVVEDRHRRLASVPDGVEVTGKSEYLAGTRVGFDLDVYQMGNHPDFHSYMHAPILDLPGALTLHDPALHDFYAFSCGGCHTGLYLEEAAYNDPTLTRGEPLATVEVDGVAEPDRLRLLMSRRLVEASLATAVHSNWARTELQARFPKGRLVEVPQFAEPSSAGRQPSDPASKLVFGVFGGLDRHKRVEALVRAFGATLRRAPSTARLVIAGRTDNPGTLNAVREAISKEGVSDEVELLTDVAGDRLAAEIERCDVAVSLRWPTAGETSAVVMQALAAGKPVVVSDLPQYRELGDEFCWRVSTDGRREGDELAALMSRLVTDRAQLSAAGERARNFVAERASSSLAVDSYCDLIESCAMKRRRLRGSRRYDVAVNVFADWDATTGLAEAARRSAVAMVAEGVEVSLNLYPIPGVAHAEGRVPPELRSLNPGRRGPVDLWYLNVNELDVVADGVLRPPGANNYVVASWFWELPNVAPRFTDQIARVDEIWAGSSFIADSFRGHTDCPVQVMPVVVELTPDRESARRDFGLPEEACLFFFNFDANSTISRKNPIGVIRAFTNAFNAKERSSTARLVLKAVNLDRHPATEECIIKEVAAADGILITEDLTRREMDSLLGLCDVFVSLHRSEGFGLGLAEAMYLGKPAIATAYSGNMDFMTASNSCLVGYELRPIDEFDHRYLPEALTIYPPGELWAEPNIYQATCHMRWLWENPAARRSVGQAGAATIRERYSAKAAGQQMASRLSEIQAELSVPVLA